MSTTSGPSATPTGKRAERSRRAIVTAAREAFLRDGFAVGMDAIAASAGVSKMTVYNHFGSKEELFSAVVADAQDEAIGSAMDEALAGLADAEDVREALTHTARTLVAEVTHPSVLALRNLVTGELRRFPELGRAWHQRGPGPFATTLAKALRNQSEHGRLVIADPELATIQFCGLTLYPHLVANSFGATLPADLADRLITDGVDTFLGRYQPQDPPRPPRATR
jgi:TetR/AcrR family transcriptional repressor of mexJK operon